VGPDNVWHVLVWGTPLMIGVFHTTATLHLGLLGVRFATPGASGGDGWAVASHLRNRLAALCAAAVHGRFWCCARESGRGQRSDRAGCSPPSTVSSPGEAPAPARKSSKQWVEYAATAAPYLFIADFS